MRIASAEYRGRCLSSYAGEARQREKELKSLRNTAGTASIMASTNDRPFHCVACVCIYIKTEFSGIETSFVILLLHVDTCLK